MPLPVPPAMSLSWLLMKAGLWTYQALRFSALAGFRALFLSRSASQKTASWCSGRLSSARRFQHLEFGPVLSGRVGTSRSPGRAVLPVGSLTGWLLGACLLRWSAG